MLEDRTKLNISEKLKKEIEGIQITNIELMEQEGQTMLLAQECVLIEEECIVYIMQ